MNAECFWKYYDINPFSFI
ncbi:MAG: hypothetical protein DRJ26_02570 [Candidatus Methanomethylicota archaeon]|uniref:Uncharacterized protein n=1 Tax=Thermoproteota archaeon TaxID=2056631 RepID=A0A497F3D2_9CREN|nr:MAG: hypothetical protein DRJ26_02570 [Candidatus Verstraetearchaeota archaeon]